MTADDILKALEKVSDEFSIQLARANTAGEIEFVRIRFLGRKSELTGHLRSLPTLAPEERAVVGKQANALKLRFEAELETQRAALQVAPPPPSLDVTLPGRATLLGRLHPITQTIEAILSRLIPMGFQVVEGPELELEYYNFDALNIPREHPSRESFDTFFVDIPSPEPRKGRCLLRSHTSPVQVRIMERSKPPLRIVVPGKVFRPDPLDPSHSFMFHQVEGLMVDARTSFADLKGVLDHVLKALFGNNTQVRFRPHFFPFTEPSAEVDIACASCAGRGCSTCGRKGWLEIMGCGMVHPNVFKAVGYDPQRVQGFAFGMGVERIAMLMHGITDIRLFFENDRRFLEQF